MTRIMCEPIGWSGIGRGICSYLTSRWNETFVPTHKILTARNKEESKKTRRIKEVFVSIISTVAALEVVGEQVYGCMGLLTLHRVRTLQSRKNDYSLLQ
mmetsp:Transcript_33348/g.54455  ORF Transcript_33348/g.54455 Transcript_33348/m.54455 type:complete len:99 (-) Transcript_33348:474-770(-)